MLFFKECRKVLFSLTFIIYLIATVGNYFSQFVADMEINELFPPVAGTDDYGTIAREIPEILMPNAAESLVTEYLRGYYIAYPVGFYKEVRLSEKKSNQLADIIEEITGISRQELNACEYNEEGNVVWEKDGDGNEFPVFYEPEIPEISIPETMTYEHFRELMKQADKIIGGGSEYSEESLVENFSQVPRTYEEALEEYNDIIEKDRISGAFARLFCDYAGIAASVLPAFVAAALVYADKKSRMTQLIYARKISSFRLVVTRFAALSAMLTVPIIILAFASSWLVSSAFSDYSTDMLAIPAMSVIWLVPNVMFSAALGMMITEVSSPLCAVLVQGVIWFANIMNNGLVGDIGKFTFLCRHNSVCERAAFINDMSDFIFSRIFYAVLSVVIIALTAYIYDLKRKGGMNVSVKDIIRKSEA